MKSFENETFLLQLLLATKTPADRKEKMWSQIESEMCLQRSKTIAQMCKTKQEVKCRMREESSRPLATSAPHSLEDQETEVGFNTDNLIKLFLRRPVVGSRR